MTPSTSRSAALRESRHLQGLLSALVPGLGQMVRGDRVAAAFFFAPALLLLAAVLSLALNSDLVTLGSRLVDPSVLFLLLVLQIGVLVWRLAATVHALGIPRRPSRFGRGSLVSAALIAFVAVPQLGLGVITAVAYDTSMQVFEPVEEGAWDPVANSTAIPTLAPSENPTDDPFIVVDTPGPGSTYVAPPEPTPTPNSGRVTVLLLGIDALATRRTGNTDTMIVASLDPVTKTVSLLSIPRDMVDVPLPGGNGRIWSRKINSLASWAGQHLSQFPGAKNGESVLAATLGEFLGVHIDYWAAVDMQGLVDVVDAVGGVDVNVQHAFCDPEYFDNGISGFSVKPGRYHMDGLHALAYARVRHATGESDFTRAARQQEVIVALRDRLVSGGFLRNPVGLLRSLARTVRTSVPPSVISTYARLGNAVSRGRIYTSVVTYPLVSWKTDSRGFVLLPDQTAIRGLVAKLYPSAGTMPQGTPLSDSAIGRAPDLPDDPRCGPQPTPTPKPSPTPPRTPSPTPKPAATPTAKATATPARTSAPTPKSTPTATFSPAP